MTYWGGVGSEVLCLLLACLELWEASSVSAIGAPTLSPRGPPTPQPLRDVSSLALLARVVKIAR